jgi:hypothetical protein
MKLKSKEISAYREQQLQKQNGLDPITLIKITAPALDHDHSQGNVRMVLQREVNAFEGKIFNAWRRYLKHLGIPIITALEGLCWYYEQDFTNNPIHPTHRSQDEKRERRNKLAKRARDKKKGNK